MHCINISMDGSRLGCCLTVVWKRCRDGALPIHWPLLSCIIPTLFAYFLARHPYIFLHFYFLVVYYTIRIALIFSLSYILLSCMHVYSQIRHRLHSLVPRPTHTMRGVWYQKSPNPGACGSIELLVWDYNGFQNITLSGKMEVLVLVSTLVQ